MKNIFKLGFVFLFFFLIWTNTALAVCKCNNAATTLTEAECKDAIGVKLGCTWMTDGGSTTGAADVNLTNPLGNNNTSVPKLIGQIIKVALSIVGSLALVMFVYGGFTWMLAAGNEQAITKGKNILSWAAIGLVVIFASYSAVSFVIESIAKRGG
jgi:hypothetical protein